MRYLILASLILVLPSASAWADDPTPILGGVVGKGSVLANDQGSIAAVGAGLEIGSAHKTDLGFGSSHSPGAVIEGKGQISVGFGSAAPQGESPLKPGADSAAHFKVSLEGNKLARFKSDWTCSPSIGLGFGLDSEYASPFQGTPIARSFGGRLQGLAGVSCLTGNTLVIVAPLVSVGIETMQPKDTKDPSYATAGARGVVAVSDKLLASAQVEKKSASPTELRSESEWSAKAQVSAVVAKNLYLGADVAISDKKTKTLVPAQLIADTKTEERSSKSVYVGVAAGLAF